MSGTVQRTAGRTLTTTEASPEIVLPPLPEGWRRWPAPSSARPAVRGPPGPERQHRASLTYGETLIRSLACAAS